MDLEGLCRGDCVSIVSSPVAILRDTVPDRLSSVRVRRMYEVLSPVGDELRRGIRFGFCLAWDENFVAE